MKPFVYCLKAVSSHALRGKNSGHKKSLTANVRNRLTNMFF